MTLTPAIQLRDGDKLEALRRLDQHRQWRSLDERRYCIVCCNIVTGREIQVVGSNSETGPLRAICPTSDCHSIPMDWVRPTDEILANQAALSSTVRFQSPIPDQVA